MINGYLTMRKNAQRQQTCFLFPVVYTLVNEREKNRFLLFAPHEAERKQAGCVFLHLMSVAPRERDGLLIVFPDGRCVSV